VSGRGVDEEAAGNSGYRTRGGLRIQATDERR
jgi:hypothetical protein